MEPKTKPFSGTELLEALAATGIEMADRGLQGFRTFGSYCDTNDPEVMAAAQTVLADNGYHISLSGMHEGHFYTQQYVSHRSDNASPRSISLRFVVSGATEPPKLLLMYPVGVTLKIFDERTVQETRSSLARVIEGNFERTHRDINCFWMPVFEGSPFLT